MSVHLRRDREIEIEGVVLYAMASRSNAFSAVSSISSPPRKSIARHLFPSSPR